MNTRLTCGLSLLALLLATSVQAAPINLLLSTNGGVADINGASGPGSGGFGTVAAGFNDGNPDGAYGDGFTAHSQGNGAGNFMEVTIPTATAIKTLVLYNRTDCCNTRIDNSGATPYTLTIYNGAPGPGTIVGSQNLVFTPDITGVNISGQTITLASPLIGNVVRITQNYADFQNLAELEAYAPVPEPASVVLLACGVFGLWMTRRNKWASR